MGAAPFGYKDLFPMWGEFPVSWCVHNWVIDWVKKTMTCTKCKMVVNL